MSNTYLPVALIYICIYIYIYIRVVQRTQVPLRLKDKWILGFGNSTSVWVMVELESFLGLYFLGP